MLTRRLFKKTNIALIMALAIFTASLTLTYILKADTIIAVSVEPEKGTLSSCAAVTSDTNASNGLAVTYSACPTTTSPVTTVPALNPVGISGNWTLKFNDEFNATKLDTTKWSTGWLASGITPPVNSSEPQCYDPNQVTLDGSSLVLTAISKSETCGGVTRSYASGMINTNSTYNFTYGVMEARIWMPGTTTGLQDWPAFWADGQNWPTTGEIDTVEVLDGQTCYHFHYTGGGPGGCSMVNDAATGWHTYAAKWQPGSIVFYYDGVQVGQQTIGVTSAPMYLIVNLALSEPYIVPATMKVDYVRVWQ